MLKKEEARELNDFEKAQMASADTNQLDFYGIQKGDMADVEAEASEDELSKMMYKMMEQGLSKMMEDEDSAMSKMMYKMMRKMMDEDSDEDEVSKDQMELPGMSKAIVVEAEALVAEALVAEAPATRGRDALMGWLNN
tara:strand:+ start:1035 stop:1448 length:414 start_codon:yes stop_codon:yes gene_type:complete